MNYKNTARKEYYAVLIDQVKEIKKLEKITKVPHAGDCVLGIINLREMMIPVIDVKKKLGFSSNDIDDNSSQRILVAEIDGSLTGFLVDEMEEVMKIQAEDIGSSPPGKLESLDYIKGIVQTKDKLIVVLNMERLIGGIEKKIKNKENITDSILGQKPYTDNDNSLNTQEKIDDDIPDVLKEVLEEDERNTSHINTS